MFVVRHFGLRKLNDIQLLCRSIVRLTVAANPGITANLLPNGAQRKGLSTFTAEDVPLTTHRKLDHMLNHTHSKEAWLETLCCPENKKLGIIDLHPDVFATFPRIDILWYNVYWQKLFKHVDYRHVNNRAEMRGGGRKPWQQKGTGRARHGSIRSPLWINGGKVYGPRGPKSYFFMLPKAMRSLGLRVALSVKYAQNDLHIVDSLDLPSNDPQYLKDLVESRGWGLSVLFVDDADVISGNLAVAVEQLKSYNVMPAYGLNVYSMLKYETLVLTVAALDRIEKQLLFTMHNVDYREVKFQENRQDWNV